MNIKQAKAVPIESLMPTGTKPDRIKGDDVWYRSPFRDEKTASFKLQRSKNLWYDHGLGSGGDVIKFVQTLHKLPNVSATLAKMDELVGDASPSFHPPKQPSSTHRKPTEPNLKVTHLGPVGHPALLEYLQERGINDNVAADYLQEIHYQRGNNKYFAIALANDTGLQTGNGFEVRNAHFKGSIGPKDIRTVPGDTHTVNVYEGVFDYLSHLSLTSDGKLDATAIILNSVGMKQRQ